MRDLGVTEATVAAWEASCDGMLTAFEHHLERMPFVLGGRPSTADFGLLGPLYAHLYRDPVPGRMMRDRFPRVVAWCERVHDRGGTLTPAERASFERSDTHGHSNAYKVDEWLTDDEVPPTVLPLLQCFVHEMWPVLKSTCRAVKRYVGGRAGVPLPGKSFNAESFDQMGWGPLTHSFSLPFDARGQPGSCTDTRMVVPYHIWMLQRVEETVLMDEAGALPSFLRALQDGSELLDLPQLLDGCRVRKLRGAPVLSVASRV
jgi:hypothetical protein